MEYDLLYFRHVATAYNIFVTVDKEYRQQAYQYYCPDHTLVLIAQTATRITISY